ncbi:MAG: excinuclease ABC subunit UvrC [Oscillospiraceae bacterium]|nr:excinuclease ABC subunit UvrC [Oscillospiraceae bacterium]MDY4190998.1 excinuclease ABC subunit UvrC [Oscillospiraceae bacterium]
MNNPRLPYLREKVRLLPKEPGVYLMRDKNDRIIYVGKAKALKNRVSSYFRSVEKHTEKVYKMVENVYDFNTIVTDSEFEALVLECSLIKQHAPKYNILLKDDKGYHYIKVTDPEGWSRIQAAMQRQEDDARYIGPYISSYVVRQTVEEANRAFQLPTCSRRFPQDFKKTRPCLNFYIKQCMGVCRGKIPLPEYREQVSEALDFIRGGSAKSIERLTGMMEQASGEMEFEKAAAYRDRIRAIQKITEHQKVVFSKTPEQDVVSFAQTDRMTAAAVLKFREERLVDKEDFLLPEAGELSALRREFLMGYYDADIPKVIAVDGEVEDRELLERLFSEKAGRKVSVSLPQRGDNARLVEMAKNNAAQRLAQETARSNRDVAALDDLARLLGLSRPPVYIEAYDISNIGAGTVVAGMAAFENGKPKKDAYKKFNLRGFEAPDDYACMREVISRRFSHYEEEKETGRGFGRLPDLILLDGGRGHVAAVRPVLEGMGFDIPVFGMVKDDRHRTRAIARDGGEIAISAQKGAFDLVTRIQDEVHRFAITYSRSKHRKSSLELTLTRAPGIGPARARELYRRFKTLRAMREATVDQLAGTPGMTRPAAEALHRYLTEDPPAQPPEKC